jgi:hypothetical protein
MAQTNGQYHSVTLSTTSCPNNMCVSDYLGLHSNRMRLGWRLCQLTKPRSLPSADFDRLTLSHR